jgi:hypothetical protein
LLTAANICAHSPLASANISFHSMLQILSVSFLLTAALCTYIAP